MRYEVATRLTTRAYRKCSSSSTRAEYSDRINRLLTELHEADVTADKAEATTQGEGRKRLPATPIPNEQHVNPEPSHGDAQDERVPAWTMPDYTKISRVAAGGGRIWLPLHVGPDGDSLGSNLAFAGALKLRGYDCVVVSTTPSPMCTHHFISRRMWS